MSVAVPRMEAPKRAGGGDLLPGRLLRRAGAPKADPAFRGVQIDDPRLAAVLSPDAPLLAPHEGAVHAEGPACQASRGRLLFSDVPSASRL